MLLSGMPENTKIIELYATVEFVFPQQNSNEWHFTVKDNTSDDFVEVDYYNAKLGTIVSLGATYRLLGVIPRIENTLKLKCIYLMRASEFHEGEFQYSRLQVEICQKFQKEF